MAIMIPDQIPDKAPMSEKIIFENLMRAPQARNWIVFHSEHVDNPKNSTRPREIDFLILTDNCAVICLEAKGGSYTIRKGEWIHNGNRRVQSPPQQALDAMYALKTEFHSYFGHDDSLLSLGCTVVFTNSAFPPGARSPKEALIIEYPDAQDPDKLAKKLAEYAEELPTKKVKKQLEEKPEKWLEALDTRDNLRSELEPDMTITMDPKRIVGTDLETLRQQMLQLTDDQLSSLELINSNDRCVIDGAAGTGKTVLAMELARQRCERGETVALLCSNPNLSSRFDKWAKTLSKDNGGRVIAGTPAKLPFWAFRENENLKNEHRERLNNSPGLEESLKRGYDLDGEWSSFIDKTIEDLGAGGVFDYLIVDEAQNLCDEMFLEMMNVLLKGTLVEGPWTMFGDFTHQDIVASRLKENEGVQKVLEDFNKSEASRSEVYVNIVKKVLKDFNKDLSWTNHKLKTNCRNTHEVASTIAQLVDINSPAMSGVHGPLVERKYFKSAIELEKMLENLIDDWQKREFRSEQIILLSSGIADEFNVKREYGGWKLLNIRKVTEKIAPRDTEDVLIPSSTSLSGILRHSNIYDFQGLESDLAILVMPVTDDLTTLKGSATLPDEGHLNRVLYTGMSRAKTMLVIIAHEAYEETLERRIRVYNRLIDLGELPQELA